MARFVNAPWDLARDKLHKLWKALTSNWTMTKAMITIATIVILTSIWLFSWVYQVVLHDWTTLQQTTQTEDAKKRFDASLEIAKTIVGGIGTLATIIGGIFLYLNFRIANKNTEIANRNAELTESRLITERFSKAVEQLGSDKIEVRLGGIYALERVALDSKRDHWTIMKVLTSFIQEKRPLNKEEDLENEILENEIQERTKELNRNHGITEDSWNKMRKLDHIFGLTEDVQAALTVIGRLNTKANFEVQRINLTSANLANIRNTRLNFISLSNAKLSWVDLSRTALNMADLSGVSFEYVNLSSAGLTYANLSGASLFLTILVSAYMFQANLRDTNINGTNLSGADLTHANLQDANISGSNFSGANLSNANFSGANLSNANFHGAKNLTNQQIKSTTGWEKAIFTEAEFKDGNWTAKDEQANQAKIKEIKEGVPEATIRFD